MADNAVRNESMAFVTRMRTVWNEFIVMLLDLGIDWPFIVQVYDFESGNFAADCFQRLGIVFKRFAAPVFLIVAWPIISPFLPALDRRTEYNRNSRISNLKLMTKIPRRAAEVIPFFVCYIDVAEFRPRVVPVVRADHNDDHVRFGVLPCRSFQFVYNAYSCT